MTTKTKTHTHKAGKPLRFPDYPPRDDMQNWLYLYEDSATGSLIIHFGDSPDVIVANEVPLRSRLPVRGAVRIPDLMVIFGADRELMELQRGYEIALQGKAPDFVLEVASHTTGVVDYTAKRSDYESYGALEYWRFDPTGGEYHDAPLAGDRLIDGRYRPIAVETMEDGEIRGYSEALGLYLCWTNGELRFYDPAARAYLRTHRQEAARANAVETRASAAETRVAELEAELRRLRAQ